MSLGGAPSFNRVWQGAERTSADKRGCYTFFIPTFPNERLGWKGWAVETVAAAAGEHPSDDQLPVRQLQVAKITEPINDGAVLWKGERSFELGFFGLGANLVDGRAATDQESNGVDQNGFAGTGLARQDMETPGKLKAQTIDDGEIGDAQLSEHKPRAQGSAFTQRGRTMPVGNQSLL